MYASARSPPIPSEKLEAMLNGPAQRPPPGLEPNLKDPWSMHDGAEVALYTMFIVCTLLFAVHMFTQLRITRRFYWEDKFLILTWVVYAGAFIPVGTLLVRAPMGVHQWDITLRGFGRYLFLWYTEVIIWGIAMLLLKVIILLQFLRLFSPAGVRNSTFWASHICLWVNVVYYVLFTFLQMFSCSPREAWWDKTISPHKCLDIFAINVSGAVICLVSDLTILTIPQRVVLQLKISTRKKIGVCFLFAIGVFACVTSVVRLYYDIRLWQDQTDITYQLGFISYWGTAQIPAGFFIICLPSVPKSINYLRDKPWFSSLEISFRSLLHLPTSKSTYARTEDHNIVTIGGGNKRNVKGTVVSDLEFHDLVNTQNSIQSATVKDTDSGISGRFDG